MAQKKASEATPIEELEALRNQAFKAANRRASKELDGFARAIKLLKDKEAKEAAQENQPPAACVR